MSTLKEDERCESSDGKAIEVQPLDDDKEGGLILSFQLEEDLDRKDQLFSFRQEKKPIVTAKAYKPTEQQLLQEGKLGDSEFSARLQKVNFGTFKGRPACLLVVQVDFVPKKNRGWFRFRNATVEIKFENIEQSVDVSTANDSDEEEDYHGPVVCKFDPGLIRGHIQTAAEAYNIQLQVPLAPVSGAAASAGWSVTSPKEGLHLVHGRLMGDPPTSVKWVMNENEVSRSGIYEQPTFAIIVRHEPGSPFAMTVNIKATTYGGIPVKGKRGSRITLKPPKEDQRDQSYSIQVDSSASSSVRGSVGSLHELTDLDLGSETSMKEKLLSRQGPGGGSGIMLGETLERSFDAISGE